MGFEGEKSINLVEGDVNEAISQISHILDAINGQIVRRV